MPAHTFGKIKPQVAHGTQQVQRAAHGVIQRHRDDPDVTTIDWSNATSAKPSPPSAMGGVVFVVVDGVTHVVKPTDQPAAALFGETMLEDVAGVETTQSKPVAKDSAEGMRIFAMLGAKKAEADAGEDNELKTDWGERYTQASTAKYFLIQKTMIGANQFSKVMKDDPGRILNNPEFLKGLGRTFAVDTLTGNDDRFGNMNFANVFLTADDKIAAIDTDAILQNYAKTKQVSDTHPAWPMKGTIGGTDDWAKQLTQENSYGVWSEGQTAGTQSSKLTDLFEKFDVWFKSFKGKFVNTTTPHLAVQQANWDMVKASIKQGISDGNDAINNMLSGDGYGDMHEQFSAMKEKYNEGGDDPNFDWQAFQVKAMYLLERTSVGGTAESARLEAAFVAKQPDAWATEVRGLGEVAAAVQSIPAPPGKLSMGKKSAQAAFDALYAAILRAIDGHATRLEALVARTEKLYADRRTGGLKTQVASQMLQPIESLVLAKRLEVVQVAYTAIRAPIAEWDKRDGGSRNNAIGGHIARFRVARSMLKRVVESEVKAERSTIVTRGRSAHTPAAPLAPFEADD